MEAHVHGTSNAQGHGIGAIITSPTDFHFSFTIRLCFDCTNNTVKYDACIFDIKAPVDLRIKILEVYIDLALVIRHLKGDRKIVIAS